VFYLTKDQTLSRIKETEELAKKKLILAEKKKLELIEEARTNSISLISESDKKDNEFREKEIQKTKEKISKTKEKLIQENAFLIQSIKKKASAKLKTEAKVVVKKFSEEVFS